MLRSTQLRQNLWTETSQLVLKLLLHVADRSLPQTLYVGPGKDRRKGVRCWSRRLCKASGAASHSPARSRPLLCLFCLASLDEPLEISRHLISSIDFSKTQIYFFSFCWMEDAENGSWFTLERMDLAEWFNSSHAAGCRKILSHLTKRMFLLSLLVITYLHELAQLGGSGGSCVAPSVCISYHWFGGQIIKPRIF